MKPHRRRGDRETKNSLSQRTNMKASRMTTNDCLENQCNRCLRKAKLTAAKRKDQEEFRERGRRIMGNRRSKLTSNFSFHHLPGSKI
jgi:hypothetical protein